MCQQTTLPPKLGLLEISTLWRFRPPLLIQIFIKVASSPILSEIGMHSPILWSHLLKMQRIVLLSSLLWGELGTNSLITGPGEWLSFRRFTSKLSWSWSINSRSSIVNSTAMWYQANWCQATKKKCPVSGNVERFSWVDRSYYYYFFFLTSKHSVIISSSRWYLPERQ